MRAGSEPDFRISFKAEIDGRMKLDDVPSDDTMSIARAFAEPLAAARHVDHVAWRCFLPVGAMTHIRPDERREDRAAYDAAMAAGDPYGFGERAPGPARVQPASVAAVRALSGFGR